MYLRFDLCRAASKSNCSERLTEGNHSAEVLIYHVANAMAGPSAWRFPLPHTIATWLKFLTTITTNINNGTAEVNEISKQIVFKKPTLAIRELIMQCSYGRTYLLSLDRVLWTHARALSDALAIWRPTLVSPTAPRSQPFDGMWVVCFSMVQPYIERNACPAWDSI